MKKFLLLAFLAPLMFSINSCDEIDGNYLEPKDGNGGGGGTSPNGFYLGTITGSVTSYTVEESWVDDSTEITSSWTYTSDSLGSSASITFTWHGITSSPITATAGPASPVSLSGSVSIATGNKYGTLKFNYSGTVDTTGSGTGYVVFNVYFPMNVLIEDFTGHKCGNCPRATRAAYDLKTIYGEQVSILAVHAGFFASTNIPPFTYDFKCPEGIQLDNDFGISAAGNPNGMVNRKKINGSYIIDYLQWGSEAANIIDPGYSAPLKIEIENTFDSASGVLNSEITCKFRTTLTGTYNIIVYLAEDSIINWQKDYDVTPNDVPNYAHREVLRGSMNGTYGSAISSTNSGDKITSTFTSTLNSSWDASHMSVIAIIADATTKEIIQVEQLEIEE